MCPLEACEDVDTIVFTGDQLHDEKTLKEFEEYVDSWKREIGRFKELIAAERVKDEKSP